MSLMAPSPAGICTIATATATTAQIKSTSAESDTVNSIIFIKYQAIEQ